MSDEKQDPYNFNPFYYNPNNLWYDNNQPIITTSSSSPPSHQQQQQQPQHHHQQQQNLGGCFEPSMTFADCLQASMDYKALSTAFDISCSSSEVVSPPAGGDHLLSCENNNNNNNNVSSVSSSEAKAAAAEEDSGKSKSANKDGEDGDENKSKKVNKPKKEKREKQARFAFLTKSEIDHLEDGYRWRKYGQKAVKNSPYPRSYYRCTTQKCMVKKRVERSFQDPTIVITTYEGQHNHHCPVTLRGNAGHHGMSMLPPSLLASVSSTMPPSFPQDFLSQLLPGAGGDAASPLMYYQQRLFRQQQQQQELQADHQDHGMLLDLVPPFVNHKQKP